MAEAAAAALSSVRTYRGSAPALQDISLAVLPGEIVTLLGAPGSGKTSILRLLAGLELPASGQVLVGGQDAGALPPRARGLVLVGYEPGLAASVRLARTVAFAGAFSGGDSGQRMAQAVARALASSPRALLLDEPAGGLNRPDREALFARLRTARAAGLGVLYATGNPEQAIPLGDRMLVLDNGAIRQEGIPQAVYDDPADAAVAALTGPVNLLAGEVQADSDEGVTVRLDGGPVVEARSRGAVPGRRCLVGIRPEHLAVAALPPEQLGEGALPARVEWITFHGDHLRIGLRAADAAIVAARPSGTPLRGIAAGRMVSVAWQAHHACAFPTIAGGK